MNAENPRSQTADLGVATAATWIGHPAVRGVVEKARAEMARRGLDIGAADQIETTLAFAAAAGLVIVDADGVPHRHPEPDPRAVAVGRRLMPGVTGLGYLLARLGVPLDPGHHADRLTLALMLTLDVDWTLAPLALAEQLQPLWPVGVSPDGLVVIRRRGLSIRDGREVIGFAARVEARHERDRGQAARARRYPVTRAPGRQQLAAADRRAVLADLLDRWPELTVADLLAGSGHLLEVQATAFAAGMAARGDDSWRSRRDVARSARTLRRDLEAVRAGRGG